MSYTIAGSLFRTRRQAVTALVEEFLTASGTLSDAEARNIDSAEDMADQLLEMWGGNLGANWEDTERDEEISRIRKILITPVDELELSVLSHNCLQHVC
jgi:DNA-directed RNA polymerase alpha subunit